MVESLEEPPPARHPLVAGDDIFVGERLACVPRDPEFTRAMVRPPRPALAELVGSTDDREGIVAAHIGHGYSLRQIAARLGCSVTTVQRRVHADGDEGRGLIALAVGGTKKTPSNRRVRRQRVPARGSEGHAVGVWSMRA